MYDCSISRGSTVDFNRLTICEAMVIKLREPLINRQDTGFATAAYSVLVSTVAILFASDVNIEISVISVLGTN